MTATRALVWGAVAAALFVSAHRVTYAEQKPSGWTHPRSPWGDPDLTGMWPITDLNGTPVQRPANFGERRLLTDDEYAQRVKQIETTRERTAGAWAEIGQPNRLTSLVVEPANGRLPPLTDEGRRRAATMTSTWSEMLFDRLDQFNPLDRCITRGLPASMLEQRAGRGRILGDDAGQPGGGSLRMRQFARAQPECVRRLPDSRDRRRSAAGDHRGLAALGDSQRALGWLLHSEHRFRRRALGSVLWSVGSAATASQPGTAGPVHAEPDLRAVAEYRGVSAPR